MPACQPLYAPFHKLTMARLHLSFESASSGETTLRVKQQQPPWRVVRGFRSASGETLAHLHNLSGGILDTDNLECQLDLASHAQAQVTSTGATRVYRSRSRDRTAVQRVSARVGAGAYLEFLPDQLIPFSGSRFEQIASVDLDESASVIWWDRVAPGREASDEIFRFNSLAVSFELAVNHQPIAIERWTLDPQSNQPDSLARLGPFHHFATCYVCRAGEPGSYWRNFESEMQSLADRLSNPEILWGVSSLRAHGIVIRGVATSGRALGSGLLEFWKAAKWSLCGRVATLPRKIH